MADLLDRIRGELQARLQESRAAVEEYERLQEALTAMNGAADKDEPSDASGRTRSVVAAKRRARPGRGATAKSRKRAPRGQNRSRVLNAIGDRPGVTPLELAAVSGVKGPTLYTVLRRLVDEGTVAKREPPGGETGYALSENQ